MVHVDKIFRHALVCSCLLAMSAQCMDIFEAAINGNLARIQELIAQVAQQAPDEQQQTVLGEPEIQDGDLLTRCFTSVDNNLGHIILEHLPTQACKELNCVSRHLHRITKQELAKRKRITYFINQTDPCGSMPLFYAVALKAGTIDDREEIVRLLIKFGANPNTQNPNGSALHMAAINNNPTWIKMLLDAGANPNVQETNNFAPLHYAIHHDYIPSLTESLIDAGADVNVQDHQRRTPLHYAAERNIVAAVKLLLAHEANPHLPNSTGQTPLHIFTPEMHAVYATYIQGLRTAGTGWHPDTGCDSSLSLMDQALMDWILRYAKNPSK